MLFGCSASTGSRLATATDEEARSAIDAETAPSPAAPSEDPPAAKGPFYEPDPGGYASPVLRRDAPNMRYVRLDRERCETELRTRGISFERVTSAPGVLAPVRLRGPLRGVTFRSELPPAERERSTIEIFDCRLVLALDDFAALLAARDVVEVVHLSAFRTKAQGGCTPKYSGKQHCAALAVDLATFKKKDGSTLVVDRDFHGKIGMRTCMPAVRNQPRSLPATELWGFICDAADRAIFHVLLTPNFNAQHKNHFHVELTPDAGWMLVK